MTLTLPNNFINSCKSQGGDIQNNKCNLFKPIKSLDAQIRTIEYDNSRGESFVVDTGLYESLGEQGEVLTQIYDDEYPTEHEIIRDVIYHLKQTKREHLKTDLLSGREEAHLEILKKLQI